MPYISAKDNRREKLRLGEPALTAGELNYQIFYYIKHAESSTTFVDISHRVKGFVDNFLGENPNYQRYNDMTGALIRCAKEIDRRLEDWMAREILIEVMGFYDDVINKYEDEKIESNGDVE